MTKHILVTGGAGYIGSILVPMLVEEGYRVTVIDNFHYGQASLNQLCRFSNFRIVHGDIRVESTMRDLLRDADIIIPLAAYVGAPLCMADPIGAHTVNHDAVTMMLDNVSADQAILMPTTNSAYGSGQEGNYCTEESPLRPISQYAIDKVEIEAKLMQRTNSLSFRLATVFGMSPRMRLDLLVNDFVYRALNDRFLVLFEARFKRNYIHVYDVSRAFVHGINQFEFMRGEIYNVGLSDANVSKQELCQCIGRHLPDFYFIEANVGRDPDQRNYVVSNAKIEATGFAPCVSLDQGIAELLKGLPMIGKKPYANI